MGLRSWFRRRREPVFVLRSTSFAPVNLDPFPADVLPKIPATMVDPGLLDRDRLIRKVVLAGPDCLCGHARIDHVGESDWFDGVLMSFFDGACQIEGCDHPLCKQVGYLPGDGRTYMEVMPL
jgi:hypothetical protein